MINNVKWSLFVGLFYRSAGANGPAITEAYSRSGNMLEQHLPYAPTFVWPKGTLRSSFGRSTYWHCPTHNKTVWHNSRISYTAVQVNDATIELSEEKRVLGSKVIPLLSMLHHSGWESEAIKGETSCHWHHCSIWGLRRWATLAPIKLQMQRRGSLSNVQLLSETAQPHT